MHRTLLAILICVCAVGASGSEDEDVLRNRIVIINSLDTCISETVDYFHVALVEPGYEGYFALPIDAKQVIDNWWKLLSNTGLSTKQKVLCIKSSIRQVLDDEFAD